MQIVFTISQLRQLRDGLSGSVGFVPTMGYLHEGHLSLIRQARQDCDFVVVSIFVNPTQFGPSEDLSRYPRDLQRDKDLLSSVGLDFLWIPTSDEMYPSGYQTWVTVDEITQPLEGEVRPGHFRGVATIVAKLFNVVQPDRAYFGQKDAQQAVVIRRMAQDLNFPVDIVVCPIVREPDGLAMSSRNVYLSAEQRKAATVLFRSLSAAREAFANGEREAKELIRVINELVSDEPLARIQYISCTHPETLQELEMITEGALLSMAVYFGGTRLIDNMLLVDSQSVSLRDEQFMIARN